MRPAHRQVRRHHPQIDDRFLRAAAVVAAAPNISKGERLPSAAVPVPHPSGGDFDLDREPIAEARRTAIRLGCAPAEPEVQRLEFDEDRADTAAAIVFGRSRDHGGGCSRRGASDAAEPILLREFRNGLGIHHVALFEARLARHRFSPPTRRFSGPDALSRLLTQYIIARIIALLQSVGCNKEP